MLKFGESNILNFIKSQIKSRIILMFHDHVTTGTSRMLTYGGISNRITETDVPKNSLSLEEFPKILDSPVNCGYSKIIFAAICSKTSRAVALKAFPITSCPQKLTSEFDFLYRLNHKNILEFIGVSLHPKKFCMVEPLMDLSVRDFYNLRKKIYGLDKMKDLPMLEAEKVLSPQEIAMIGSESLEGLSYLHSQNIPHSHFKSDNVLLNLDQTENFQTAKIIAIKICDAGLKKLKQELSASNGGQIEASVRRRAPETFERPGRRSENVALLEAKKTDIYGYGLFLAELRKCQKPFKGLLEREIVELVAIGTVEETPADYFYHGIVKKCCSKAPLDRPSAEELFDEMKAISIPTRSQDLPIAENVSLAELKNVKIAKIKKILENIIEEHKELNKKFEPLKEKSRELGTKIVELDDENYDLHHLLGIMDIKKKYEGIKVELNNPPKKVKVTPTPPIQNQHLLAHKVSQVHVKNAEIIKLKKNIADITNTNKERNKEIQTLPGLIKYRTNVITNLENENSKLREQLNKSN